MTDEVKLDIHLEQLTTFQATLLLLVSEKRGSGVCDPGSHRLTKKMNAHISHAALRDLASLHGENAIEGMEETIVDSICGEMRIVMEKYVHERLEAIRKELAPEQLTVEEKNITEAIKKYGVPRKLLFPSKGDRIDDKEKEEKRKEEDVSTEESGESEEGD